MVKCVSFGVGVSLGFKSWLCSIPAVGPWASHLLFPELHMGDTSRCVGGARHRLATHPGLWS